MNGKRTNRKVNMKKRRRSTITAWAFYAALVLLLLVMTYQMISEQMAVYLSGTVELALGYLLVGILSAALTFLSAILMVKLIELLTETRQQLLLNIFSICLGAGLISCLLFSDNLQIALVTQGNMGDVIFLISAALVALGLLIESCHRRFDWIFTCLIGAASATAVFFNPMGYAFLLVGFVYLIILHCENGRQRLYKIAEFFGGFMITAFVSALIMTIQTNHDFYIDIYSYFDALLAKFSIQEISLAPIVSPQITVAVCVTCLLFAVIFWMLPQNNVAVTAFLTAGVAILYSLLIEKTVVHTILYYAVWPLMLVQFWRNFCASIIQLDMQDETEPGENKEESKVQEAGKTFVASLKEPVTVSEPYEDDFDYDFIDTESGEADDFDYDFEFNEGTGKGKTVSDTTIERVIGDIVEQVQQKQQYYPPVASITSKTGGGTKALDSMEELDISLRVSITVNADGRTVTMKEFII